MERTLISLNVPNIVTIGLIAVASLFLFSFLWQLVTRVVGQSGSGDATPVSTGGSFADGAP